MRRWLKVEHVGTRPFVIVLVMMLLTVGCSFLIGSFADRKLIEDLQGRSESLSQALEISVQQLTSAKGSTDEAVLTEFVERLFDQGVREISILSADKEVVAKSRRVRGDRKSRRAGRKDEGELVITGTLGGEAAAEARLGKIVQVLEIPIVVDNEKRGYLRLRLLLDDVDALLRQADYRRLAATASIFLLGISGIVLLSFRTMRDLNRMAAAAVEVAAGNLSVRLETDRRDEVGDLIRAMNGMVDKLREKMALEARLRRAERTSMVGSVASAVAHEIRNPLNLIRLSVDTLEEDFHPNGGPEAGEYRRILEAVKEEIKRLDRMVSDFLAYGRPLRLAPQPCRVEEILDDVLALAEPQARERGITIFRRIPPGLPGVTGDPEGLRRCFLNVAVNAVQAMPAGGSLVVEAASGVLASGEPSVNVRVKDSGQGIPPADLERIFEPYFSTRNGGVGLGLAITRRILEEHGGGIRAESEAGKGSTFLLDIPVRPPALDAIPEAAADGTAEVEGAREGGA